MSTALCIALVGAESTGKTELAQALAARLGGRVAWVPEVLREWCARNGRTPQAHEQASILRAQHERIDAAAASHDIVVCDTTALMTAVYSRFVFGDRSLDERAALLHWRRIALTLLMALDLPWVADGLQRDGPQVRKPVDSALRELMQASGIAFSVIGGSGPARLEAAIAACAPLLLQRREGVVPQQAGLFSSAAGRWSCACCRPDEESALPRSSSAG